MSDKNHKVQIWVAIIGMIGVLSAALISNWEKIFSYSDNGKIERQAHTEVVASEQENTSLSQVDIYYYPSRKLDARTLKIRLENEKYLVNLRPASGSIFTKEVGQRQSYVYFNEDDYSNMQSLRQIIESHLGHSVNVNKAKEEDEEATNSFDLILTNNEN